MLKYLTYFNYYLETFCQRLNGKNNQNPLTNGEYKILTNLIKDIKTKDRFIFIDGGANVGEHSLKVHELCAKYNKRCTIFSVECHAPTIKLMRKNLKNLNYHLINKCLGSTRKKIYFYSNSKDPSSGQNSNYRHYYLNEKKKLQQITIDDILTKKKIKHVNFLKLDIEGSEYKALMGAKKSLRNGHIDYIQIEYNQTWIKAQATIEKLLFLSKKYNYCLFRIKNSTLLRIDKYNYILDDFAYSNLLMVKKNCKLPLPSRISAIPDFSKLNI